MLPAPNIFFSWLHITLCPEAVSHLAAACLHFSAARGKGEMPWLKRHPRAAMAVLFCFSHSQILQTRCCTVKRSRSKSRVALLWAKHMLSVITLIKKFPWGLKGPLCLQNRNIPLVLPICMVGKESNRFILTEIPLLSFSPDANCTLQIYFLSNPLRMAALFLLLVSRHLSTSICLAKTIRYLCHVN